MNEAEKVLRKMFRFGEGAIDAIGLNEGSDGPGPPIHPEARHSLFGPSGLKEYLVGRDAFLAFANRCAAALSARRDEILEIVGIDDQCAFVRARAWRKAAATGEEITYEWAMLYRVEDGLITYGADMLDADAQAFWASVEPA